LRIIVAVHILLRRVCLRWVVRLRQGNPSADHVALFSSVAALLFIALLFFVVIAMLLPWAVLVDVFGD
jgi:hypothetical protein